MPADLDSLRAYLGSQSTRDDSVLAGCLDVATAWVTARVYSASVEQPEVQQAVLLLAARLYKRRQSPEGVSGWDDLGVVRIMSRDPDIAALLANHINVATQVGVA